MIERTCCVTGHRVLAGGQEERVKAELRLLVERAVLEGCTHFISGFAEGADLWFAQIVLDLAARRPDLTLEAAVPYRKRLHRLLDDTETRRLVHGCAIIGVHSEEYSPDCYQKRNRFMVKQAGRVIAVYDGRKGGGTAATLRLAQRLGRQLWVIDARDFAGEPSLG